MKQRKAPDICYLCAKQMGRDRTRDHVPPQSFFPEPLRKVKNFSRLDVVYAHRECNGSYKLDEQYFFQSLAPLARRTEAGPSIGKAIEKPILTPAEWRLRQQVAREFYRDATGQARKTFQHERLYRVAKKIIRGLHFLRWHTVMPDNWRYDFSLHDPYNKPPEPLLKMLEENIAWGEYPEVFFFKVVRSERERNQVWVLFLWDWAVIPVVVHEGDCLCDRCAPGVARDEHGLPSELVS
jgi:hypothetical protein